MSLDKTYQPQAIESKWYQHWQQSGYFAPQSDKRDAPPYCIMIPPPNVTGSLHMGHAFQDTIMDALTRYHRMQGHNTLWQPGTDHAGIATQMVVERLINAEGKTRHEYGREAFLERVWQWKEESGGNIKSQLKRLGASADWEHERFTMDEGLSEAVKEVFVRLYDEGLIYRGKRLVNWDPKFHTALSDLEVLSEEEQGKLWHLRYPIAGEDGHLVVATTRPETMLGDAAVAVHPSDERYQHLLGKMVALPLTGRLIPVIADEYVDPEFGSGCVKITPAHDFNDYAVWQRHQHTPSMQEQVYGGLINIMTVDAAIRENVNDADVQEGELIPSKYSGMSREQAREAIVADFQALNLLEKIDDHRLNIPRGDRSGAIVEPFLTDQWYVDLTKDEQADGRPGGKAQIVNPAIEVVRSGDIEFVPSNWSKTYFQWLENIEDWCISRQLWWGHRIPAWYDSDGNIYVGRDEGHVREKYALKADVALRQDDDVLDTWFSSALWPFSTLGWPQETDRLKTFYPTSVLVTGFDIIFFWVARMIMFGQKFVGDVPFKQVYITGLVRDAHGQKMSKSKGNVLDPIDLIDGIELQSLIEKKTRGMMQNHMAQKVTEQTKADFPDGIPAFGTDALRFTFAALATNGRDINFDLGRTEGYRNFCNKIWNAARYVLMNTEGHDCGASSEVELSVADRWIVSQLQRTITEVTQGVESYRFDFAARALYEFIWNQYCDWYLELCKPVLTNERSSAAQQAGARQTLVRVLETTMRLLHPIMPFISEEIWQKVAPLAAVQGDSLMMQSYPKANPQLLDEKAEAQSEWMMQFILAVRQIKGEMNIAPSKKVSVLLDSSDAQDLQRAQSVMAYLHSLAKIESLEALGDTSTSNCAMAQFAQVKIYIPLDGLVDVAAEIERITGIIKKLDNEVKRLEGKLGNEKFVANAPAQVVEIERQKLADAQSKLHEAKRQMAALK